MCVFKNTDKNNICASIVFKAESKPKQKKFFFAVGFLQKPKTHFCGGPKWYFLKVKFQICISGVVLYCKRTLHANVHKKILIFGPPGIFGKWKLWRACASAARALAENLGIWTSKIIPVPDLWLMVSWPVLTDQKKFPHSTLLCTRTLTFSSKAISNQQSI